MDVLIVNTNTCRDPVPVLPVGACAIAETAEVSGHRVRLLDLMFAFDPADALRRAMRDFSPHVVGFSVRNLDNTTMQSPENFVPRLLPLVRVVRDEGDATLVLGGSAFGVMPEPLMRLTGADWGVIGEGERPFTGLLAALSSNRSPEETPGVAWVRQEQFRANESTPSSGTRFHFPQIERWIDLKPYLKEGSTYALQSKRGCAFTCHYCPCPRIEGDQYRLSSPVEVALEVRRIAVGGIRDIEFVDTVFNAPYEHALAVCRAIAEQRVPVRLHTFELNPAFVDSPLLEAMGGAGFSAVGLTAESASGKVLSSLGKNYGTKELCRAAEALRRSPLPCLWIFMLGGPGETPETVRDTFRFAREHLKKQDVAFFAQGIRIYPGTLLERRALTDGSLSSGSNLLSPTFYLSPDLTPEGLHRMVAGAVASDPRFLTFGMESLRFLPRLRGIAGRLGIAPPLWRHTALIRRGLGWIGICEPPQGAHPE